MKLLQELTEQVEVLKEDSPTGPRNYFIKGIFLQGNIKNQNGRIYPTEVLDREVGRYTEQKIRTKCALGECGHPNNPGINLDRASHLITELRRDGDNFIGTAKIMNTPMGGIIKSLMDEDIKLGVSSRGLGALEEKGNDKIVTDFYLVTAADIVAEPSAPEAFVENIMENTEWVNQHGEWIMMQADKVRKTVRKGRLDEEKKLKIFNDFLSSLSNSTRL